MNLKNRTSCLFKIVLFIIFSIFVAEIIVLPKIEHDTQTLVLIVAVVIGQIAITVFVNRYIHKQSLVERMRD